MSDRRRYIEASDRELLAQCSVDRLRGPGPGGQKRNKTSSAVRLRHQPTGLRVLCNASRSQHRNRDKALRMLRALFAFKLRDAVDPGSDHFSVSEELQQLIRAGTAKRGPRQRERTRYLHGVAQLIDLYVAVGYSVEQLAVCLDLQVAVTKRLLRIDDRLVRTLYELRKRPAL